MESQSGKIATYWIIAGVVVLIILGFGGYKLWHHYAVSSMMQPQSVNNTQVPSQNTTPSTSGLSNKTDTSNQQLNQDLQSVQNSMNQLQQDHTTVNSDTTTQPQDVPQP